MVRACVRAKPQILTNRERISSSAEIICLLTSRSDNDESRDSNYQLLKSYCTYLMLEVRSVILIIKVCKSWVNAGYSWVKVRQMHTQAWAIIYIKIMRTQWRWIIRFARNNTIIYIRCPQNQNKYPCHIFINLTLCSFSGPCHIHINLTLYSFYGSWKQYEWKPVCRFIPL